MRKRRRWSQAELAKRLGVDRSTVTKLENGKREVGLDEAFGYAAVLGVPPTRLMAPLDNTPVAVAPGEVVEAHEFRAWLRGTGWVRPDDVEYMPAEVDVDAWAKRLDTSVSVLFHRHNALLQALEPFIAAGGEEAVAEAGACFDAAQRSLDEFALAVAERQNPRSLARRRVRQVAAGGVAPTQTVVAHAVPSASSPAKGSPP